MQVRTASLFCLPEGENDHSPGWSPRMRTEPWEQAATAPAKSRRDDRNSPPNVPRIVLNSVFLQERDKLRLEIALPMMLFLPCDVRQSCIYLGPSNGESPITFLPLEIFQRAGLMHPMRGRALDVSHCRGYGQRRRHREQKMNMVLHSADAERFHFMFAGHTAHVRPQPRLNLQGNCLAPILGGEDAMKQRAAIGV